MPFKNSSAYIREAIHSISTQTYDRWELIAIDDHSTDHSPELVRELSKNDFRIRLFSARGNGIIDALTQALEESRGIFITRFDSDDIMPQHRLELMINALYQQPENVIITGLLKYISSEPISKGYLKYETWINKIALNNKQWTNIYRECTIASPNWLAYKNAIEKIGGFKNLEYPEDYDLIFLWYKHHFIIKTLTSITLHWREHPSRTSRISSNYTQQTFFRLKIKRFIEIDYDPSRPLVIWGKGIKANIAKANLKEHSVPFENHELHEYKKIELENNPFLLIAIYPDQEERNKIESYLERLETTMTIDWWYL